MTRIIIAGGRKFKNYDLLCLEMDKIILSLDLEKVEIVSGKANGADTLGEKFAKSKGIKIVEFPAKWKDLEVENCIVGQNQYGKYNKLAGHNRNKEMLEYAKTEDGILVAFWDGKSTGTKNMIEISNKAGLKVIVVKY